MVLRLTRLYPLLEADGKAATGSQDAADGDDEEATGSPAAQQSQKPNGASAGTGAGQSNSKYTTVADAEAEIARQEREIARLRRENAKTRVEAKGETAEQQLTREIEEARQAEAQAKADLQRERMTTRLTDAARDAYVAYPALFAAYYAGQVKYNDKGEPENVSDLLAHARKHFAGIFNVPKADGGTQGEASSDPPIDMNALMRKAARRGGGD